MKLWKCSYADAKFSKFIRERDQVCQRCGTVSFLTCSHFWGRRHSATRFDPDNCVALCSGLGSNQCHEIWENKKNNEYKHFMLERLGKKRYNELEKRARSFMKRTDAILECMNLLHGRHTRSELAGKDKETLLASKDNKKP